MLTDGPILDTITFTYGKDVDFSQYPFSLSVVRNLDQVTFNTRVTFFVGENGSGKSTILEAIATKIGFGKEGGSKSIRFLTSDSVHASHADTLADRMRMSWRKKPRDGYFFRAESFFNVGNYLDDLAKHPMIGASAYSSYGGKSLHEQSHGESFLSFFDNRLGQGGFYILDEPEAALSPQRQLALLKIIDDLLKHPESQFIIATHSPILLAYPGADIYSCDGERLAKVEYEDTSHYRITKDFLDNPERYLKHLLSE